MKIVNTLNYEPLNTVQSKYFFGYTGGDNPKRIATSKQLWKFQDLANKIYHYYLCIENAGEKTDDKQIKLQMADTKRVIDEITELSLPMSLDNMAAKIKLLTDLLESALPKLQETIEFELKSKSA